MHVFTATKLKEYEVDENAVLKILTKVSVMRRQVEIVSDQSNTAAVLAVDILGFVLCRNWKRMILVRRER